MQNFINSAGGYLTNPEAPSDCQFCSVRTTDQFLLASFNIHYENRWRDIGVMFAFTVLNVGTHLFLCRRRGLTDLTTRSGHRSLCFHLYFPYPYRKHHHISEKQTQESKESREEIDETLEQVYGRRIS